MRKSEVRTLRYTLMHKNIAVAEIDIDETLGGISNIRNIISKEHLPVGVVRMQRQNETVDRYAFNQWWTGRSIPASRMGLSDMLDTLGIASSNMLLTKCLGLSLSDHYWIKPYDSKRDKAIKNPVSGNLIEQKTNNENPETDIVEGAKLAGIQHTSRELSIQIINIAVILILFFGIKIALRFVTALANAVAKLPILNKLNKVGGLIYGLIRGIVIVYACLLLISFIGKVDDTSVLHKTVEQSNIGKTMYENNILNILL